MWGVRLETGSPSRLKRMQDITRSVMVHGIMKTRRADHNGPTADCNTILCLRCLHRSTHRRPRSLPKDARVPHITVLHLMAHEADIPDASWCGLLSLLSDIFPGSTLALLQHPNITTSLNYVLSTGLPPLCRDIGPWSGIFSG